MTHKVVVIGSITTDLTAFTPRLPAPGETILGTSFTMVLGGKGANQAVAAARAGASTYMVGCVGDDAFHSVALNGLAAEGIDTMQIASVPGPTGIAHIRVDAAAENDIVMVPLANDELTPERVVAALDAINVVAGDVALIQLEIPRPTAYFAAAECAKRGMTVVLDPAPAPTEPLAESLWQSISLVTPNETEARLITGITVNDEASAVAAGQWFVSRGVDTAIVTLAGAGAVVVRDGSHELVTPFQVVAIDTTAAGDAFAGALGAAMAAGADFADAMRHAMAAGALAVTVAGASPSLPTAAAVTAFLAERTAH